MVYADLIFFSHLSSGKLLSTASYKLYYNHCHDTHIIFSLFWWKLILLDQCTQNLHVVVSSVEARQQQYKFFAWLATQRKWRRVSSSILLHLGMLSGPYWELLWPIHYTPRMFFTNSHSFMWALMSLIINNFWSVRLQYIMCWDFLPWELDTKNIMMS